MQLRKIFLAAILSAGTIAANAQTGGSNTSYSRFGLGSLAEASSSYNRNMGGTGVALRSNKQVNIINPASYAACDSLSFILDVGMSAWIGSYSNSSARLSVKNARIDNVNALFRVRRNLGMSIGFMPFSSIGYNVSQTKHVGYTQLTGIEITSTRAHEGEGGLHNLYAGLGWEPFKGFSIGANMGYVWGSYNHNVTQTFAEGGKATSVYGGLHTQYAAEVRTYKADAGVQYVVSLPQSNSIVIGATVGLGHKAGGDATIMRYTANGDTVSRSLSKAIELPWSYGVGVSWQKAHKWVVAADYRQERWGNCTLPQIANVGNSASEMTVVAMTGAMSNRHHFAAGIEYTPDMYHASYLQRVHYRAGASYTTPYNRINDGDGPNEISFGVGVGLPITNQFNNRSVVNVGLQWTRAHTDLANSVTENYFKLNIGITFNDSWFVKWKIR